jgi:hypothetical protein
MRAEESWGFPSVWTINSREPVPCANVLDAVGGNLRQAKGLLQLVITTRQSHRPIEKHALAFFFMFAYTASLSRFMRACCHSLPRGACI